MRKHPLRGWAALILAFAMCLTLMVTPAFAVSGQVTFTGVDTMMIYNPMVDYVDMASYGTLSTGNMYGQIKTSDGNFSVTETGEEQFFPVDIGARFREGMKDFRPVISGPVNRWESLDLILPNVSVGTQKTFFYWPDQNSSYKQDKATFTCLYAGENCLVWGYEFSDKTMADTMGKAFDELIYANNTSYFGTSRFIEDGVKMNVLVYTMNEPGIAGFFWGAELYTAEEWGSSAGNYNAGMPIIHINTSVCTNDGDMFARYGATTVAHEHQHLVCMTSTLLGNGYWDGISMGTWLNEAMAKEAEELSYPGMVVYNGYVSGSYNKSGGIAAGQSLYNFDTYYDIGVYGQGFLFSEYIKQLYGGAGVYRKIHDHWRTAAAADLTDAKALYAALPQSVRADVLNSVAYPGAVTAGFSGEAEEFLSKLALSFHVAGALKEESGIYGLPDTCEQASPKLFTGTRCSIECGGRIFVKTKDGNSYTVPSDASDKLIYVGFKNGEMVIAPTTAENYAASRYTVRAETNDPELGTAVVSGSVILAAPAEGCGYAVPAYTVTSGSARVEKSGNAFMVYPSSDCTIRINFEKRAQALDVWDGSVADSIPASGGIYVISTCAQLAKLSQMVNGGEDFSGKTVRLAADLDLNGIGWTPIGSTQSRNFKGVFDGNGYTVSNLTVETDRDYVGLFGYVSGAGSAIRNLSLENVSVYGGECVGALVGRCYNTVISNCRVSGTVGGARYAALLCGYAGTLTMSRCAAEGMVLSDGNCVGGLVGIFNSGSVLDCYSRSTVTGASSVGGLVGKGSSGLAMSNCYWAGTVTASEKQGGIAGEPNGMTCSGCYYSTDGCEYGAGGGAYTGAAGLNAGAMKQQSSYAGWDFTYVWKMAGSANDGMPMLCWQAVPPMLLSGPAFFDKAAFSEDRKNITLSFAGNGSELQGVKDVPAQYVTVERGTNGGSDTLTVHEEYLRTLPVGTQTLYAAYSNGYTVPFTVEVVDTTPDEFIFRATQAVISNTATTVKIVLSVPEETEVMLVLAAYRSGRMVENDAAVKVLSYGCNITELTLDILPEDGLKYGVFLMTEAGLMPLGESHDFTLSAASAASAAGGGELPAQLLLPMDV